MARSYRRAAEAGPAENPYLINSISPGRLQFNDTWGVSDDVYFRPMVVNKFREQQALGWCDGFVASDELRAPVAIVCRPASSGKLAEQINRSIAMAESTYGEGMSYTDIMKKRREAAHANEMAALLVEDNAKMFDTVCYVILRSTGREKLDEMEDYLKSSLSHYGNGAVHQIFNTKEAFLGASPLLADDWYSLKTSSVPLPAITIAWGLPTGTSGLDHLVGVEIGKDDRGGIVRLNCTEHTEELPNGNIFLSGETGSGKSTTGKKIVLTEHVVLGTKVIVPNDPEGEWGRLALSCGGEVSRVGVDSKFSPFEPRNIGVIGEDGEEIDAESSGKELVLASTLPFLMTFLKMAYRIPDDLIDRIRQSRNYNVASACLRQVSFGLLDMAYYTQKDPFEADIIPFEKAAWQKAIIGQQLPQTCMTTQFSHIMAGGYAAGYYSYKWAEVLETDAFGAFQEHGIFDQATAQRFRDCVLSKGGTEHPMTLYKRFRGHEPTIDAMLRRDGIKKQ